MSRATDGDGKEVEVSRETTEEVVMDGAARTVDGGGVVGRYKVGCAGMFVLGMEMDYDDEDEAIVACETGPAGCEVYDTQTKEWIGPVCFEDIAEAKRRLDQRVALWQEEGR